jgi:hypothetical protein
MTANAPLPNFPVTQVVNGVISQLSIQEFLAQNPKGVASGSITLSGSIQIGDKISVKVVHPAILGGKAITTYATVSGSLANAATGLAAALNANGLLDNLGISAFAAGAVVTLEGDGAAFNDAQISVWVVAPVQTATVAGTFTIGDSCGIEFTNTNLDGGSLTLSHTVISGDTNDSGVATALKLEIDSNSQLEALGITATVTGAAISIDVPANIGAVTVAGVNGADQTVTITGVQTETAAVSQFAGGTGPIVPLDTFDFRWNGLSIVFYKGVPQIVESDLLAALVAAGKPIS